MHIGNSFKLKETLSILYHMTYLIKENIWSLHGGKSRCKMNQSDFKLFKTFDTHHEKTCPPGFRPVKTNTGIHGYL